MNTHMWDFDELEQLEADRTEWLREHRRPPVRVLGHPKPVIESNDYSRGHFFRMFEKLRV